MKQHGIVYSDPAYFAGWPANHGAWQWGDEFLVGFMRGPYSTKGSMHHIKEPFERLLFRSLDGGETWFQNELLPHKNFDGMLEGETHPPFTLGKQTIIRVCGVYDTGGDYTTDKGCFYLSKNFGTWWDGPFNFDGIQFADSELNTSRTCVVGDLVFMSAGNRNMWGTDYTFVARHDGTQFQKIGIVCADENRAVMPSVVRVNEKNMYCVLRRRGKRRVCWIDSFKSHDNGLTWQFMGFVDDTGSHNGNPPALAINGAGDLICVYGNRDYGELRGARWSRSQNKWETYQIRASEHKTSVDIGYPVLFKRNDGHLVAVYYWVSDDLPQQHIAWTQL